MGAQRPDGDAIDRRQAAEGRRGGRRDGVRAGCVCPLEPAHAPEHEYPLIADDGKRTGTVLFGRVKLFHVRSDLFIEGQGTATDIAKLMPVSRLGGISYGRTTRIYELERPSWAKVEEEEKSKSGAGQAQL